MAELPKWSINDLGVIFASKIHQQDALQYTFMEAVEAHNTNLVITPVVEEEKVPEKEVIEVTSIKPPISVIKVTKAEVNSVLSGMYSADGVRRWWTRPRRTLDDMSPTAMWEIEPERVIALFRTFWRDDSEE
jgi:hypothetical protein